MTDVDWTQTCRFPACDGPVVVGTAWCHWHRWRLTHPGWTPPWRALPGPGTETVQ